jgi:hypothetical protein
LGCCRTIGLQRLGARRPRIAHFVPSLEEEKVHRIVTVTRLYENEL